MKYILFIILAVFSFNLSAQQKQFSKDDQGKFIYYKVVDSQQADKNTLVLRAKDFVGGRKKGLKLQSESDSALLAKGTLIIDKTILVVGHPSGEVNYNLTFEARNGKYRFWLTDLEYIPYQRDRYGNFVATTKIATPLEKSVDKLTAAQWRDIQAATYDKVDRLATDFKKFLATDKMAKVPAKTAEAISTKKW